MSARRYFSQQEYDTRRATVSRLMEERDLDAFLVASPENIFWLTGLDHQGYFAYEMLIVTRGGDLFLITRAMEAATVRDQVPDVTHVGYGDASEALPPPVDRTRDLVMTTAGDDGERVGLEPWSMSLGMSTREDWAERAAPGDSPVSSTVETLRRARLETGRLGLEMSSSFLPHAIVEGIRSELPHACWSDISGMIEDCRMVQSPRELECTRRAAALSDSMMLAAIAAAGTGVFSRDVMAAIYDAMFRRGGTYPGFVPLVRSTRTLQHEHGTWQEGSLRRRDVLFLEMAGCVHRYHAPIGRLVFIGTAPAKAERVLGVAREAMQRAAAEIRPGVAAGHVYAAWQSRLDEAGLKRYRRHHCGYSVGIGFPPSWSGSGPPIGLRAESRLELRAGMVFHLMSWLLRTGLGDAFLSDTVVVTETGCEFLTTVPQTTFCRA